MKFRNVSSYVTKYLKGQGRLPGSVGIIRWNKAFRKKYKTKSRSRGDSSVSRGAMTKWWYVLSCMPNTKPEWTREHPP